MWLNLSHSLRKIKLKKKKKKSQIWSYWYRPCLCNTHCQIGSFPDIALHIHGICCKTAWRWILLLLQVMIFLKMCSQTQSSVRFWLGGFGPEWNTKHATALLISDTNQTEAPPTDTEWSFRQEPSWNDFHGDLPGNDRKCLANTERELDEIWA